LDKRPIGVSYHSGKYPFAGSALGPSYTFRGIQREGVQLDAKRDVGLIRELAIARPEVPKATAREMGSETAGRLRATITAALDDSPALSVFVERLQAAGIQVQMNVASTGYVSGVRFVSEGSVVRGSQLGREFSI